MEDYYAHLEIRHDATATDIRAAYRRLAFKWHPDKNPNNREKANRKFKQIAAAYKVLSNPGKRAEYDYLKLSSQRPRRGRQETYYSDLQDHRAKQRSDEDVSNNSWKNLFKELSKSFLQGLFNGFLNSFFGGIFNVFFNGFFNGVFKAFKIDPSFRRGGSFYSTTKMRKNFTFTMASYSTVYVNGKKIVTRTRTANNKKIMDTFENGKLKSSTTVPNVPFWSGLIKTLAKFKR